MKVEFSNNRFMASHSKAPRGTGTWAFETQGGSPFFAPSNLSLKDAKAWATKQMQTDRAGQAGFVRLFVSP
jgi:hypothetical protein